jgi:hypothetical protein
MHSRLSPRPFSVRFAYSVEPRLSDVSTTRELAAHGVTRPTSGADR